MSNRNIYLASKPRYEILDGLRGVAAMLVVAYHLFETYFSGKPDQLQVGLTRLLYPFFCGLLVSRLFNSGSKFFTLHSSL